jgi:endo-1,4-beta-xylanase
MNKRILGACAALLMLAAAASAQNRPLVSEPLGVPAPGRATDRPYAPQPILQGGIIVPLYPEGSKSLNQEKAPEPEKYNMTGGVPGRIASIVNIHNPSIELHTVPASLNTGSVMILVPGGGHRTLNVGSEGADFVPFFYNYGVNTVILRNRLRSDGYEPFVDGVNDALQSVRVVRAHAKEWGIDPNRIGIMGFSAGAELSSSAAVSYVDFDRDNGGAGDPYAGVSSRPDFVGIIYPGPTPFSPRRTAPEIPKDVPPAFLATPGSGDRIHAIWATEYFTAMLTKGVPNLEMHVYGNGSHPGTELPDGSRMSGGLTDRGGIPLGTWQYRLIDWMRDLGFFAKPGVETKAAKDVAEFVRNPPKPLGQR